MAKIRPSLKSNLSHNDRINKFEVSKIYMTACMCIYKFCQIKKYMFMIFFYSKTQMIFVWIFMIFHVLLHFLKKIFMFYYDFKKIYSIFFRIFQDFLSFIKDLEWCFITFYLKNIHVLSMIFMKFSRFFQIFQDLSCFIKYFEWFLIVCILFIKYSCFINDFDDFFKIF